MSAVQVTYGQGSVSTMGVGLLNRLPADSRTAQTAAHARHVELDARRERDEMRYVLDSMGIGFWDWDIPSLEVWYSSYVHELLGYTGEDAARMVNIFRQLIHPEDEEHTEAAQNAILYGGEDDYRAEFRVRHKEGHWVWIEAIGRVVVRAADGTALRLAGMFNGIDQRKREQSDAAFLNRLTQALLETNNATAIKRVAIRMLGQHLGADRVSFGRLNGTASIIVDMDWLGADIPPLSGEWKATAWAPTVTYITTHRKHIVVRDVQNDTIITDAETREQFAKTQTAAGIAVPLIIEDDVRAMLIVSHGSPRNWQDHEIELVKAVAMRLWDSVLRARAEDASRANRALLKLALRMAKLGAREMNLATGIVTTSDNFYNVIGHPDAADMSVDEYMSHVHPEDREALWAEVLRSRTERGDGMIQSEHRVITADENIRHISMIAQYFIPAGPEGENRAYSAAIVQDITEARERELATSEARLQLMKHSRLSAMGIMASTLAHELNQPLATAANYLSIIEALTLQEPDKAATDVKEFVGRALAKVLEAGQTIRRVRNFAADGVVQVASHALRDLVFRALSSLFGRAGKDDVAIINAVDKAINVRVDPLMVEHAIVNVVRNAVDALAGQQGARVHIDAQTDGDMVRLTIADNGPGMSEAVAANLFVPFVTGKVDGTGLGLAISRTMIEANGGKIIVKEHGPKGTLFCICLPVADTTTEQQEGN